MVTSTIFYRSPWTPTETRTSMEHSTTRWIAMNVTSSAGVVRIEAVLGNCSDGMFSKYFGTRPFDRFRCPETKKNVKRKRYWLRIYFRSEEGAKKYSFWISRTWHSICLHKGQNDSYDWLWKFQFANYVVTLTSFSEACNTYSCSLSYVSWMKMSISLSEL